MRSDPTKSAFAGRVCRFESVLWGGGDAEVLRVAKRQHGCLHRRQIMAAGIAYQALRRRVAQGRLEPVHTDVFLAWPCSSDLLERAMAAALQFRGDAVVGGPAAAAIWGMVDDQAPDEIDVTLVGRNANPQAGVRIHRVATLGRDDVRWRSAIPLTSPARTLIDIGAALAPLELENALAQARFRSLVRDSELTAALARASTRSGTAALRRLLAAHEQGVGPARTRYLYERKLLKLITDAELPRPVTNVPVEGHEVDMFWPAQRLVVEFDGFAYHSDRRAFETDRLRDQRLVAAGYRVIRITARQLDYTPFAVIARLAQALAAG